MLASEPGELAMEKVEFIVKKMLTPLQVVQQHRRFKKKPAPKLPAPPRKKLADDVSQLSLPPYIPPSNPGNKANLGSSLGSIPPLQLYSVQQLAVEGEQGASRVTTLITCL